MGRRAADDRNSYYVPQYNTFDLGGRYSTKVFGRVATWLVTVNNVTDVHYWSTLGPGSITGQAAADLAHLRQPRGLPQSTQTAAPAGHKLPSDRARCRVIEEVTSLSSVSILKRRSRE